MQSQHKRGVGHVTYGSWLKRRLKRRKIPKALTATSLICGGMGEKEWSSSFENKNIKEPVSLKSAFGKKIEKGDSRRGMRNSFEWGTFL